MQKEIRKEREERSVWERVERERRGGRGKEKRECTFFSKRNKIWNVTPSSHSTKKERK